MQSLIHGNFDGAARKKAYALVGAAAAIAAAVGPLLGGFVTTFLSWRVGFAARSGDHRGGAFEHQAWFATWNTPDLATSTSVGAVLSVIGMGGVVLGILVWQEGGEWVGLIIGFGASRPGTAGSMAGQARNAQGSSRSSTPTCFGSRTFGSGSPSRCCSRSPLVER